jgi:2,4-dienoyl-CoA reductase-like NADH-dependent reductase (Old Yellow Enzyme family)
MSILFTPHNIGPLRVRNRFIFSACEDGAATDSGLVTDAVLRRNRLVAKGEIGLIISTHMSVHPEGRTRLKQLGIHGDEMIQGLKEFADAVHEQGAKIVFQLGHAGLQGPTGAGPSGPRQLSEDAIVEVIRAFVAAAARAAEAGADGVQIHAAHGYLVNEFLSPYFNRRTDAWGGPEENCFRLLKEIVTETRRALPSDMALMVKLNGCDFTPGAGITPPLAMRHAGRLAGLGVDALEVSCGTSQISPWNMCRGEVPVKELLPKFPEAQRPAVESKLLSHADKFKLTSEGYNLEAAKMMRRIASGMIVFPVGGWRSLRAMEDAVTRGDTEFVSLCRPLIREPFLVKNFHERKVQAALCNNCNKCLAALANDMPVRCYVNGFAAPLSE